MAATIRELRLQCSLAPETNCLQNLTATYLPLVYGTVLWLLPESPASAEGIASAVFDSFACCWRRLPKRTVIAAWLFRSAGVAVRRERKRLKFSAPAANSAAGVNQVLCKRLHQLRPSVLNAVILRQLLQEPLPTASRTLRISETRLQKRENRGIEKLRRFLRKRRAIGEPGPLLNTICAPPPDPVSGAVQRTLQTWSPKQKKNPTVRCILRNWQWLRWKRRLKGLAVTFAVLICLLAAVAGTVVFLAQRGYLTAWFIRNSNRQLARQMPEIAQPARPWPKSAADEARVVRRAPETSGELYRLTNIWTSKFTLTAREWKSIEPSPVPPVRIMGPDGQLVLRNPKARRSGLAGVLGIDFNWTQGRLEIADAAFSNVAIRYRGNGTYINSLFGSKQSFKVDLSKFTKDQSLGGIHTLNYLNAIADNSYLHDALAEQLFRDLAVPAPRTAFVYLTLDVPGRFSNQPLGLYVLVENIDGDFAAERFGSKKAPIFKPVTYELFKDLGADWKDYAEIYDLKTKATPEQRARLIQFARLVTAADDAEFAHRIGEFLDLDEFASFVAGHVLLSSYDGFLTNGQNFYLYLDPRSNKFGFIPWDQDHSWGEFGYVATAEKREQASIWRPSVYSNRFLERVMKVEAFRAAYRRQLERALVDTFTPARLFAEIDRLAGLIRPAIAAESAFRLQRFDQAVSTNWLSGPRGGAPEGPKAPVHQIKRFIVNRVKSVRDQLDGKSEGVILARNRPR